MAFECKVCKKKPLAGHRVSHSNKKTKRRFLPNLQVVHALFEGSIRRIRVCTRCLRSGAVTKAA